MFAILMPKGFLIEDSGGKELLDEAFQNFGPIGKLDAMRDRTRTDHELRWADWLQTQQRHGAALPNWESSHARRFRELVKKGIPINLRPMLWQLATNASTDQRRREG